MLLLSGCGAHTGLGISIGGGGPVPQASAGFQIHPGQTAGTLIGLGFLAAFVRGDSDSAGRAEPELDPTRRVQERDCSKPIEDYSANLRCR
jgi:hypothetical protein